MKAIIMAGGEGTRLRPLTSGIPKPMVKLLGKPVLERAVELLKKYGITDICFALKYLPGVIEDYFGDGSGMGVNIETHIENEPMGTAGGVRACSGFIDGDDVLILSGDAVCDFDLGKIIEFHRSKKADATLVLYEKDDPSEYGLVVTDDEDRITRFIEKPDWEHVTTNRINTGIYVLSPRAVREIPENINYDFGQDLFPKLLKENFALYGVTAEGYWCDVGSSEAYLECCKDVLRKNTNIDVGVTETMDGVWSKVKLPGGITLTQPVYIGENCVIGRGAALGPNTVLEDNSTVEENARVADSVICGAVIKKGAVIDGGIVCRNARVGEYSEVDRGSVIGENTEIGGRCLVAQNVKIWPGHTVQRGRHIRESLMEERKRVYPVLDKNASIRGEFPMDITPEMMMAYGNALASCGKVGAAYSGGDAARILADAFLCGACSAGALAFELDSGFASQLGYACGELGIDNAAFIKQDGNRIAVFFMDRSGQPVSRARQRKIEAAPGMERKVTSGVKVGTVSRIMGTEQIYFTGIIKRVKEIFGESRRTSVSVTGFGAENRALRKTAEHLGIKVMRNTAEIPCFSVEEGGAEFTAVDENGVKYSAEHMKTAVVAVAFKTGTEKVAAAFDAPMVLEDIADETGGSVVRAERDDRGYELLGEQRFMCDGILGALMLMKYLAESGMTLGGFMEQMPKFSSVSRKIEVSGSKAEAMRRLTALCADMAPELCCGLSVVTEKGRIYVSPGREGSELVIKSEAPDMEIAEELCLDIEKRAREL